MLNEFIRGIEEEWISMHSIMVMKHDRIVVSHFWMGDENTRHVLHSASKSVAVLAIGLAVDEGKMKLDDRIVDIFPDKLPETVDDKLEAMTIRHLLTMTAGHDKKLMMSSQRGNIPDPDWTRYYLSQKLDRMPGEKFLYDSACSYVLSAAFTRCMGENIADYLRPRLFEPMGITDAPWQTCPLGITLGCAGLYLSPSELMKMGTLYLHKGEWEGKQLIPAWWIEECARKQVDNSYYAPLRYKECRSGYGFQTWMCHNGAYRMDGARGQQVIIWPEKDSVIVTTAAADESKLEPQFMMNLIWKYLDPDML